MGPCTACSPTCRHLACGLTLQLCVFRAQRATSMWKESVGRCTSRRTRAHWIWLSWIIVKGDFVHPIRAEKHVEGETNHASEGRPNRGASQGPSGLISSWTNDFKRVSANPSLVFIVFSRFFVRILPHLVWARPNLARIRPTSSGSDIIFPDFGQRLFGTQI